MTCDLRFVPAAPSLRVLPLVVQHLVLKMRCPAVDEGDLACLLKCVLRLPKFPFADNSSARSLPRIILKRVSLSKECHCGSRLPVKFPS